MTHHKLDFQSQKLVVDYITFKFNNLDSQAQMRLGTYLLDLGFNIYQESGQLVKPMEKPMLVKNKNNYKVTFVVDTPYWNGTLLHFSGQNAGRFYFYAKQNIIDWKIFDEGVLSRFDLYFERKLRVADQILVKDFLTSCQHDVKQKNKNIKLEKNQKGWILKIGNRRTNNFLRIYEQKKSLKFEHEMKGKFIQSYHLLLVKNNFVEFEHNLSSHFFTYFGNLLPLQHVFLDWLVVTLRPNRKTNKLQFGLNSDYLESNIETNPKHLVQFIQFLNYAQNLDYTLTDWDGVCYRKVTFIVRSFMNFKDPSISPTNRYQLKETKRFFRILLTGAIIDSFQDKTFRTLIAIPRIEYDTCPKQKYLIANVWMVNDLFYHNYPFYLPNLFNVKLTKDQFQVRYNFIHVFSSVNIEKVFNIKQFFENYPSVISNQRKTNIKKYYLELINELKDQDFIEPYFKTISNNRTYDVQELSLSNISEGFIIYEKILL